MYQLRVGSYKEDDFVEIKLLRFNIKKFIIGGIAATVAFLLAKVIG